MAQRQSQSIEAIIERYEEGLYANAEATFAIIQSVTPESVASLFQLPPPLGERLNERIATAPNTDSEWANANLRSAYIRSNISGEKPSLPSDAALAIQKERYRVGIELIRSYCEEHLPVWYIRASGYNADASN
ncbi:hypothetical protein [Novipirellula sp.]|uniref:hypothetical protein n=1 Tax=Novipirellula sp. TaxID=2795430 RepID=UPI0035657EB6